MFAPFAGNFFSRSDCSGGIMQRQIWSFLKTNPVPVLALLGLVGGASAQWGFQQSALAEGIWLVTLGLGGAPLVWHTLRGMLHGQFAADVVAMLAIVGALVM